MESPSGFFSIGKDFSLVISLILKEPQMLSIGEFSRVTQITIKALRLYHEKDILAPDRIDESSGYRYYGLQAVERALMIKRLKDMGFSLDEIREILNKCRSDQEIAGRVQMKLGEINQNIRRHQAMKESLSMFLRSVQERPKKAVPGVSFEDVPALLVCSLRFKGTYPEVGQKIGLLFRACGRVSVGKPFSLYYDGEFKEEDADIEVCVAVKKKISDKGIECRELAGGKFAATLHQGSYETLGRSYQRLFEACAEKGLTTGLPIREHYLRAPGFIFRGNPKNYLTKLMVPSA